MKTSTIIQFQSNKDNQQSQCDTQNPTTYKNTNNLSIDKQSQQQRQPNDTQPKSSQKRRSSIIPKSYTDLISMSKLIIEEWRKHPQLTLRWMTIEKFETLLNQLEIATDTKSNIKTKRSPIVSQLKQLDTQIDNTILYLKQHISVKFGKQHRRSYFRQFGIEMIRKSYRLPKNRHHRLKALEKIVSSLQHYQIHNIHYGLEYWSDIKDKYSDLLNQNIEHTQQISHNVGKKNQIRRQVEDTLRGLLQLIKIQYPDQWQYVARQFGYMREHF